MSSFTPPPHTLACSSPMSCLQDNASDQTLSPQRTYSSNVSMKLELLIRRNVERRRSLWLAFTSLALNWTFGEDEK